jgi:hypothetical protein
MANSDKRILITPNTGQSGFPNVLFTGAGNVPITVKQLDDADGTLVFEGSSGQLFAVNNNATSGSLFAVNDQAGLPILDIRADGTIRLAGNVKLPTSAIPNGSITREKLAPDAQRVINVTRHTYGRREAWSDAASATYWTFPVERKSPTSILYVDVKLSMRTNYSDCLVHECQYGDNGRWVQGPQPYDAGFSSNSRPYATAMWIDNINENYTGTIPMRLRWRTFNNSGGNKPAQIWNPNSGDDGRYNQEISQVVVWEIQP